MGNKIEFLQREIKKQSEEDKAEAAARRIIAGNDAEIEVEYAYTPAVIDIDDIVSFKKYDDDHTIIRDKYSFVSILKCRYMVYRYLTEHLTGKMIRPYDHFQIQEQVIDKIEEIGKLLDDKDEFSFE